MRELLRSNDWVLISYVEVLLTGAGIALLIADVNMSVLEGSLGILPRRVLVSEEDWQQARRVLGEAGLAGHLSEDQAVPVPAAVGSGAWRWPNFKWT